MTVQYTDNFNFPLAPDTTENWGAIINGVFEDLDQLLWQNRNQVVTLTGDLVVSRMQGQTIIRYQ